MNDKILVTYASHLAMLAALAGNEHVQAAYREALHSGYLWHQFGDLHLLLPELQEAY